MPDSLLLMRLLLAAVFAIAAVAKFADRPGSQRSLIDFGIPKVLAPLLAFLLPIVELGVAAALLPVETATMGAWGATTLLLGFTAPIGISLARGQRPDCHCFGQLQSAPIGIRTVLRNLLLLGLAAAVVKFGPLQTAVVAEGTLESVSAQFSPVFVAGIAMLIVAITVGDRHQQATTSDSGAVAETSTPSKGEYPSVAAAARPGLGIGTKAPTFELLDLEGGRWTFEDLLDASRSLVIAFIDAQCAPCTTLLPDLGRWQQDENGPRVVVISRGDIDRNRALAAEYGLATLLLEAQREVSRAYAVTGTPAAVVVGADGKITSTLALGPDAIRTLVLSLREVGHGNAWALTLDTSDPSLATKEVRPIAPLSPDARPLPRPELTMTELDGEALLYDSRHSRVHQLNTTGTLVWSLCDGQRTAHEVADVVADTYSIPADEARTDVVELLTRLREEDLLVA